MRVDFLRFLEEDFSSTPHFLAGVFATILRELFAAGVSQLVVDCWFAWILQTVAVALDSFTGLSHVLEYLQSLSIIALAYFYDKVWRG